MNTQQLTTELSVEERLRQLWQFQKSLSELDKIKLLRGELPYEVRDREDEIIRYQKRLFNCRRELENLHDFVEAKKQEIQNHRLHISEMEERLKNVSSNREYSMISRDIEFAGLEIQLAEKQIRETYPKIEAKEKQEKADMRELAHHKSILEAKTKELATIMEITRLDEEKVLKKSKDIEKLVDSYTLAAFKRIRKSVRNGLGIVGIDRNCCGGCFNRIPSQRQIDIRSKKKIIVCEHCGRILVDASITEPIDKIRKEA